MISRYKKKAMIGVGIWFGAIPSMFIAYELGGEVLPPESSLARMLPGCLFVLALVLQYFAFFWGAANLARAKGYSTGMVISGVFWPGQLVILLVLLFALPDKFASPEKRTTKRSRRDRSPIARVIRYRRNALVYNVLGILGVVAALEMVRHGSAIFGSSANAEVAGVFAFVAGYAAIIYGCWWWVRAKNWNDVIVCIGLCPLIPFFFMRFFRRLAVFYLSSGLLLMLMVVMPIIMIAVVAVLPDKSGLPARKRWNSD